MRLMPKPGPLVKVMREEQGNRMRVSAPGLARVVSELTTRPARMKESKEARKLVFQRHLPEKSRSLTATMPDCHERHTTISHEAESQPRQRDTLQLKTLQGAAERKGEPLKVERRAV